MMEDTVFEKLEVFGIKLTTRYDTTLNSVDQITKC